MKPVGLLFIALFTFSVYAQDLQGKATYMPTKLEWLALELNASYRVEMTEENLFMINYIAVEDENLILIHVGYGSHVDREVMSLAVEGARKLVETEAKNRGWTWVRVKEKIKSLK